MTPLDVAKGIAEFLNQQLLPELVDLKDGHYEDIKCYAGFLPRANTNETRKKLCPAIVVTPSSVDDKLTVAKTGITVNVTTYDEDMICGHESLYHLLERIRYLLLSNNPINMKYNIVDSELLTTIPEDQPYPQWWAYIEFDVHIATISRNLNDIFAFNKAITN